MALLIKKGSTGKEEIKFVGVSIGIDGTFRLMFKDRELKEIWFDREDGDFLYNEIQKFHTKKSLAEKKQTDAITDEDLLEIIGES